MPKLKDLRALLTENQARFAEIYVENGGKTADAALRAGYAEAGARQAGEQMLKHARIRNYIGALYEQLRKQEAPTVERLKLEVQTIAFAKITDLYHHLTGGSGFIDKIDMQNLEKLPHGIKACIQEIIPTKYGYRVKFYNKIYALEMLAKHLGFYELDNQQKATSANVGIYLPENGRPMPPDEDSETQYGQSLKR